MSLAAAPGNLAKIMGNMDNEDARKDKLIMVMIALVAVAIAAAFALRWLRKW